MKWFIILALILAGGCKETPEAKERDRIKEQKAQSLINDSVIRCADGNQVRVYDEGSGKYRVVSVWSVLDENGRPKRCVFKAKPQPQQFEEVPQ